MADQKIYYKITNAEENHHGFQYQDGLNVLVEEFNENPDPCGAGGFYFTDAEHIFEFLEFGIYLREVTLPIDNPAFKMVKDGIKYRTNMIILGKRYDLFTIETMQYIISKGANMHVDDDWPLRNRVYDGHFEAVKCLVEVGANIHANRDEPLIISAENGNLEILKYIIMKGADLHARDDKAFRKAAENGHLEVVKYLVESGANVHAYGEFALKYSADNGHFEVVKYLIESGADVKIGYEYVLEYCKDKQIIEYLNEKISEIISTLSS